jgi:hypothetical protein
MANPAPANWRCGPQAGLHGNRQRPLGASVEIDFALEDVEGRTNLLDLLVGQHAFVVERG